MWVIMLLALSAMGCSKPGYMVTFVDHDGPQRFTYQDKAVCEWVAKQFQSGQFPDVQRAVCVTR